MTTVDAWIDEDMRAYFAVPRRWLVTGAAGFIGSNLVETLLRNGQHVRGLDNFSTGHRHNLDEVRSLVGEDAWARFELIEGDICDQTICNRAVIDIDCVLHQAALGSVPRSVADPVTTNLSNITGFLNILDASRRAEVGAFVYAASSSTYGDEPNLPKREARIGNPLSPYAVTKLVNELYARVYARTYGFGSIGLRYFNVFGPRQDPNGAYAAVIPRWTAAMIADDIVTINGDGETSRDFCFVANAVQANLRAARSSRKGVAEVCNVAVGERTTLNELFQFLREALGEYQNRYSRDPEYSDFRVGDVRHSLADISHALEVFGYKPSHNLKDGIESAVPWYIEHFRNLT